MSTSLDADVIIVGSGPAGVSAAFPLLEAGWRVLMVDGGQEATLSLPAGSLFDLRRTDPDQWRWMVGHQFHALRQADAVSPKLRAPTHAAVFDGFAAANRIIADDFIAAGSLAPGGLSNAWGCGVACYTHDELAAFPAPAARHMAAAYQRIATRIGISGGQDDDLSDFFGVDDWADAPTPLDPLQARLYAGYQARRPGLHARGFRLGRARVAVLTAPRPHRQPCDLSGTCLWGCARGALYAAAHDLAQLRGHPGFQYRPGFLVERVQAQGDTAVIMGRSAQGAGTLRARRILLAAGTLATTRLALQAIGHRQPVSMQSCPTAAFMLWQPRFLGRSPEAAFGLGQLSFSLALPDATQGFGSLFNPSGIPVTEFARHLPLARRYGVDLLSSLLSSCTVGNVFLPGALTQASLQLDPDDCLIARGAYSDQVAPLMAHAHRQLRASFLRLGAILIPGSFTIGRPGSDIHYAATLPMRTHPGPAQTTDLGELPGAPRVHIIDGAALPILPAKSHTLTIMANADRIARDMAVL